MMAVRFGKVNSFVLTNMLAYQELEKVVIKIGLTSSAVSLVGV